MLCRMDVSCSEDIKEILKWNNSNRTSMLLYSLEQNKKYEAENT